MDESTLVLRQHATLKEYQEYVDKMVKERGFHDESISEIFMLFLEECGELAKAARKTQAVKSDNTSQEFHVADEAADVFVYLLDICNYFKIDLEKAVRDKEEKNKKRIWK